VTTVPGRFDYGDHGIAAELRKISERLGGIVVSQAALALEIAEIKEGVKETNGRVTALEADKIARVAVVGERRRTASSDSRVKERFIGATVTLAAVIAGAVLTDVRFF